MHCSRMRTIDRMRGGGVSLPGGLPARGSPFMGGLPGMGRLGLLAGGSPFQGSLPAGGSPCRGSPCQGHLPARGWGISLLGGSPCWGVSLSGGLLAGGSPCQGGLLAGGVFPAGDPPVNRMTDTSKNIAFATTSLWPVKRSGWHVTRIFHL